MLTTIHRVAVMRGVVGVGVVLLALGFLPLVFSVTLTHYLVVEPVHLRLHDAQFLLVLLLLSEKVHAPLSFL